jgi:hypothetical protein
MIKKIKKPTRAVTINIPVETYEHLQALCDVHLRSTNKMLQYIIDNTPLPSVADEHGNTMARSGSGPTLYNYLAGSR